MRKGRIVSNLKCYIKKCSWQISDETMVWPENQSLSKTALPPILKRRLSSLGRIVLEVVGNIVSEHMIVVTSSRNGDTDRMMRLFEQVRDKTDFSPTDFSLSVHNAIIATYSIHTNNTHMNVSLSGGKNSFALGLMEAYALCITEKMPICYLYYDEPLHALYDNEVADVDIKNETCVALILSCDVKSEEQLISLYYTDTHLSQKCLADQFIDFLKSDSMHLTIPCANGSFYMEKCHE